jgi:YD repeat-containing protein
MGYFLPPRVRRAALGPQDGLPSRAEQRSLRTESYTDLPPAPSKVRKGAPHENSSRPFGQSADAVDQVHAGPKHRGEGRTGVNYGNSRTEGFVYDAVGNRTSSTDSAVGTTAYTANDLNQYTAVGADSVTYDSKGNLTQQGSGTAYAYDSKNRLLSATGTGLAFSQTYDCSNKVVGRTLNGTTTYMVYDGWSLIAEYNSSGTLLRKFVHGVVIDEILVKTEGGADAFYHHDALGSTVLLTDNTAASNGRMNTMPSGNFPLAPPAWASNPPEPLPTASFIRGESG